MELHNSSEQEAPEKVTKLFSNNPLVLLLSVPTIVDAGSTIIGAGSQTCTAWTNRTKNAVVKGSFESWLVGFISGLNVSGERDMVGGGDFDAIIEWMDKRCLGDCEGLARLDISCTRGSGIDTTGLGTETGG